MTTLVATPDRGPTRSPIAPYIREVALRHDHVNLEYREEVVTKGNLTIRRRIWRTRPARHR